MPPRAELAPCCHARIQSSWLRDRKSRPHPHIAAEPVLSEAEGCPHPPGCVLRGDRQRASSLTRTRASGRTCACLVRRKLEKDNYNIRAGRTKRFHLSRSRGRRFLRVSQRDVHEHIAALRLKAQH